MRSLIAVLIIMSDNFRCIKCGSGALRFMAWRGLSMLMKCQNCGNVQTEEHDYNGLEQDLHG